MGRPIDLRLSASATHRRSPAAQPLSSLSLRNRSERRRDTAIEMSRALAGREFAERNVMVIGQEIPYSALMFAARMTLAHFSIDSPTKLLNSGCEVLNTR